MEGRQQGSKRGEGGGCRKERRSEALMAPSSGEHDRDLAGRQFPRNCLPILYYRV
jgi:hypothetical protein